MNYENYFRDKFESKPDYRKIVLVVYLIKNQKDLLLEIGFRERDINCLSLEFKIDFIEQHDEYLEYIKNEEESVIEKILNKSMDAYFATIFEDIRHERSLFLLLSLNEPDILRQTKFTEDEKDIIKKTAPEKLHRPRNFTEIVALDLLEKLFCK